MMALLLKARACMPLTIQTTAWTTAERTGYGGVDWRAGFVDGCFA
ncbi:MAG: hypothetical protein AB7H80_10510 [Candidatus Kapaibacterium sp.]